MGERERGEKGFLSLFSYTYYVYVFFYVLRIRNTYTFFFYVLRIRNTYMYYVYVFLLRITYTYYVHVLRIRFLVRELRIRFFLGSGGAWVLRIRFSSTYYGYYVYVFRRSKGRTGFGAFPRTPYIINVLPLRTYKSGFLVLFATQK